MSKKTNEPIAIIGSGCRFPGGATSPSKLWDLVREPRDVLCEIPPSRFDVRGFYHPNSQFPGHANVKHAYLLEDDVTKFDAQFFNLSKAEAIAIDPQQRLLLETVYDGLEVAGLTVEGLRGSNTGVYVGLMYVDYESVQFRDVQHIPTYCAIGTARSIVSNRISYFFDWHGPSMTIDTACSSSLVALHQAVQALRSGEIRVALTAGTNLILGPEPFIHESKLKMLSPDGRSRMWDQGANGYARGDGVAAVVLKTLSAALADGDHIEAIIRETGVNQDGRSRGITMPTAAAQAALIRETYGRAGLDLAVKADRCQYFEAHGTGTPAGDPVEAEAVHTAFFGNPGDDDDETERLFVGSVKTIIGHTESTAGLAGILKVVQAMKHGYIPPNMLLEKLNPDILPFYNRLRIPQELTPWPQLAPGQARRASVNSFGFGGTNAHVIIESCQEQPAQRDDEPERDGTTMSPFLFSAQSKQSLLDSLAAYAKYLEQNPDISPASLAWTLRARRSRLPLRVSLPASSVDVLLSSLHSLTKDSNSLQLASRSAATSTRATRLLGIFTGQGAQWPRMGAELIERSAYAAALLAAMDETLAQLPEQDRPSWTLREQLLAAGTASKISTAAVSQPLCTAVQVILVEVLRRCGIHFAAVVGHSSGEIAAAFAAGFLSAEDAIRIAYYRGLHSRLAGGPDGVEGTMLAVGTSLEDAQELCDDPEFKGKVTVAACNSSASVTLSGDQDAISEISDILEDENKFVRLLKVDKAYHSHHMAPCSQAYANSMKPFYPTGMPDRGASRQTVWVSSVHPHRRIDETAGVDASYWVDNLLSTVLFMQATQGAMALTGGPFDAVIEVGPHPALKGPVLDTLRDLKVDDMPYSHLLQRNSDAIESLSSAVGYLWTRTDNLDIDWDGYESAMGGSTAGNNRFVPGLPTYQWNHSQEGYWHESHLSHSLRTRSQAVHPLLGDLQPQSSSQQLTWKALLRPVDLPWIHHHRIQGQTVFPAAAYAVTAIETASFLVEEGTSLQLVQIDDLVIHQALIFGNGDQDAAIEVRSVVSNISRPDESGRVSGHFTYEALTGSKQDFHVVATCQISVVVGTDSSLLTDDTRLPVTSCLEPYMVNVDTELAYSSLKDVGYGYTGPFKALSQLRRKLGKASGQLALSGPEDGLTIHPAALDAAFHSIILAFSYPEDGGLWTLHLPTRIDRIRVDPSLCGQHWANAETVPFVASTMLDSPDGNVAASGYGFKGDVEIHASAAAHTAVQVEGLHVVPFTPATAADDSPAFYAAHWFHGEPHADEDEAAYRATPEEKAVAMANERGSYFYLRRLLEAIPPNHAGRADAFHAAYLNFAEHTHKLVLAGKHRYLKQECVNDTLEDVTRMCAPYEDKPEIKTMHVIGEQMARAIRGETTMLEHLMNNGLLGEYYAKCESVIRGAQVMAETAAQIARRYPSARFLEVGAGTGGATREVLKRVGDDLSTYAFTDISAGFFDDAQAEFSKLPTGDRITYSVLDLEQDLAIQGFQEGTYDVVVASLVLHATASLETTVRRVRSLLKPGGYLVMYEVTNVDMIRGTALFGCLPGWWAGMGEGRTLGACVSDAKWDAVLRQSGFSGVDTITPVQDALEFPNSVIVSQAVDEWVEFLREPLLAAPTSSSLLTAQTATIKHLYIVGGTTFRVSRLAQDVHKAIRASCDDVTQLKALEELVGDHGDGDATDLTDATVLVLEDLDHPVFKDTTAACWAGVKKLFSSGKTAIVWVTQDRLVDNPWGNMAIGFARSALWEHAEMRCQFVDFQEVARIDARRLAEAVLRFQACISKQNSKIKIETETLWSVEQEIIIDADGRERVPRLKAATDANDRYNSARRAIAKRVQPADTKVVLSSYSGQGQCEYDLHSTDTDTDRNRSNFGKTTTTTATTTTGTNTSTTITLQVSHSSLRAIQTAKHGSGYLLLGRCSQSGVQYLGFSDSNASHVELDANRLVAIPDDRAITQDSAAIFLTLAVAQIFLQVLTQGRLSDSDAGGGGIVLHNASAAVAAFVGSHAKAVGATVTCTTSSQKAAERYPSLLTHLHPYLRQSALRMLLPANVTRCVDLTLPGPQRESTIASCLPANVHLDGIESLLPAITSGPSRDRDAGNEVPLQLLLTGAVDTALKLLLAQDAVEATQVNIDELTTKSQLVIDDAFTIINWAAPSVSITIQPVSVQFRSDRTYWLVGLSRDLGVSIAEWMIRNGAKYLIMSSRNPNVDPGWLATAHRRGAMVCVVACDLTDYDSLAQAHASMCSDMPPIAGVYQGAMILYDHALRDLDLEGFAHAIRPKVDGSLNLTRVLADTPLDFFIFLSSVATVAGNPGQMAYTTANLFMSGLAQHRRRQGLPASVVELGLIMGAGYITREKGNLLTVSSYDRGLLTISETDVHQTLAEAIHYGNAESDAAEWQLSIGLRRIPVSQPDRPLWYQYPQFACLGVRDAVEDTIADKDQAGASVKDRLASATTKEQINEIISDSFIAEIRKMLHLSDDYAITPLVRTDELGLDSLVAVRIRTWFLNNFLINIPALRILRGAALQELIDQAVDEIPDELVPKLSSLGTDSSSELSETQSSGGDTTETGASSDDEPLSPGEENLKQEQQSLDLSRSGRLSHTQSVFLFVHELLSDKTTLNNTVMLHLRGNIRVSDLHRAIRQLGARHEALRSCIIPSENDGLHSQGVLTTASLALEAKRIRTKDDLSAEYAALRSHEFDLRLGYTTRLILLSYSPTDHYLLMSSHHIFFDRLSNDAVMMDLERLYNGVPLDTEPLQYLDYSNEQARQYASGEWEDAIQFWKGQFTTLPDPLPLHRSQLPERKPLTRYASRILTFRIDKQLTGRLRRVAREHRATPFHFHLAAFKILLHRFLGIDDVCIGIADSCRGDDHMRTGIGAFLNMLPLRMQVHGKDSFAASLAAAKEHSFEVLSHSIPLDVILNELRVSRVATHTPLAQAFLNYAENDLEDGQSFLGCSMDTVRQDMAELPYDVAFTVLNNTTGDTRILLNVQESLYTDSDALLLQHGYEDILEEFANAPNKEIGDDWIFREPMLQKALDVGRGPSFASTWLPQTLIHKFEGLFPTVADQVAVTDGEGSSLTYATLSQHVEAIANRLLDNNIQPGDRIGVFQRATVRWIPSLIAILKVGAVYVPLDIGTPAARLSLMVEDCQPSAVLVHEHTCDMVSTLLAPSPHKPMVIDVSHLQESLGCAPSVPVLAKSDAPAIILYTSGSTGTPKGVILRHSGLTHEFDHCAATYGLGTHDTVLAQSAWSFDVSVTQVFLALGVGARLHVVNHMMRADARAIAELVASEGVTATYATPTEYKSWMRRENQDLLRSSPWHTALVAGEPVTEQLLQLFREVDRPDLRLFNVYGPTETTCGSTKTELFYQTPALYQDTIPVGRASANESFYILDDKQNLQPIGQAGEVVIGGVGVAIGYLNNDERTRASFLPDVFATGQDAKLGFTTMYRTGDAGYLQPDGILVLKGRIGDDTEVKLNGVRIDLRDVESTILRASTGVLADAVASMRTTADGATKFMVVHVVFSSTEHVSFESQKHFAQGLLADLPLPRAVCPSAIIPIDELPRTVAGKVDRRALSSVDIPRQIAPCVGQCGPNLTKAETTMKSLWEDVVPEELIDLHQLNADSDFFGIGGTSLLLIELQSRIRKQLGVPTQLLSLFESSTLRSMARLLPGIGEHGEDELEEGNPQIDWAAETAPLPGLLLQGTQKGVLTNPPAKPPRTIVLTGVTGFLGQHLVRTLVAQESVGEVICIAIRDLNPQRRQTLAYLGPKVVCYEGDLRQARLGLTEEAAARVFCAADAVIHNGADVSHLKSYPSLRAANVGATAELARLCQARMVPLHYISTTGVCMFLPRSEAALGEVSVRRYEPPSAATGYVASKWAGEVYLERAAHATGQPVWIHRPSSILRSEVERVVGDGGEAADVVQNMLDYSLRMLAVPRVRGHGWVDLVRPESVTAGVVGALWRGSQGGAPEKQKDKVVYVHESGDVELEVAQIREYLCTQTGEEVREVDLEEWIRGAVEIGLSDAMAAVFRAALGATEEVHLPRLLKGLAG